MDEFYIAGKLPQRGFMIGVDALWAPPDPARIGAVLLSEQARPLFCVEAPLAETSTDAELYALVAALRFADRAGWEHVRFRGDCRAAVDQLVRKVWTERKRGAHMLREEGRSLLAAHPQWTVMWWKRDLNHEAHRLVTRARHMRAPLAA